MSTDLAPLPQTQRGWELWLVPRPILHPGPLVARAFVPKGRCGGSGGGDSAESRGDSGLSVLAWGLLQDILVLKVKL